jgi:hypothetical protein
MIIGLYDPLIAELHDTLKRNNKVYSAEAGFGCMKYIELFLDVLMCR